MQLSSSFCILTKPLTLGPLTLGRLIFTAVLTVLLGAVTLQAQTVPNVDNDFNHQLATRIDDLCQDTWCEGEFWFADFKVQCKNEATAASCRISFFMESWALEYHERPEYLTPLITTNNKDYDVRPYKYLKFNTQCQMGNLPLIQKDTDVNTFKHEYIVDPLGACIEKHEQLARQATFILTRSNSTDKSQNKKQIGLKSTQVNYLQEAKGYEFNFEWFLPLKPIEKTFRNNSDPFSLYYTGDMSLAWSSKCFVPVDFANTQPAQSNQAQKDQTQGQPVQNNALQNVKLQKQLKTCLQKQKLDFLSAFEQASYQVKPKMSFL